MTDFTNVRDLIADQLENAARAGNPLDLRHPADAVFAQFLVREGQVGDHGNPAETINAWLSRGRTEATVLSAMGAAASAVRRADRDSKLLAVIS